jgi:hypothetical protein
MHIVRNFIRRIRPETGFRAYSDRARGEEMSSFLMYLRDLGMTELAALGLARERLEGSADLEERRQVTHRLAADLQAQGRWDAHAVEIHHAVIAARAAIESALINVRDVAPSAKHRDYIYEAAADLAMILVSGESLDRTDFDRLWGPYAEALPALKLHGPSWPLPVANIEELELLLSTKGAVEILMTHTPVAPADFVQGECVRCRSRMGPWQTGRKAKVSICEGCRLIAWQSNREGSIRFLEVYRRGTLTASS